MTIPSPIDTDRRRLLAWCGLLACGGVIPARDALAISPPGGRPEAAHDDSIEALFADGYRRSEMVCDMPKVSLTRQDGSVAWFPEEVDDGWALMVSFFSTSCTKSCRLNSRILSELQNRLGSEMERVRFLSISTDPANDSPKRLQEYAEGLKAHRHWQFYTGSPEATAALQKAFRVDAPHRAGHVPVTFLRGAPCYKWVRLDGFVRPALLEREFRGLAKLSV
jgi:protein SCO1/2